MWKKDKKHLIKKFNNGFTLIEILVALAILAILIGPVFSIINTIFESNKRASENLKLADAINLAYESFINNPQDPPKTIDDYVISYEVIDYQSYALNDLKNSEYDILFLNEGDYLLVKYRDNFGNFVDKYSIDLNATRDFNIKVEYDHITKKLAYKINNYEAIYIENPSYNIYLDMKGKTNNLNFIIDGIYVDGRINESKTISFNYTNLTNENNLNVVSIYPNVFISKSDGLINKKQLNMKKLVISIFKDGRLIKKEEFNIKTND